MQSDAHAWITQIFRYKKKTHSGLQWFTDLYEHPTLKTLKIVIPEIITVIGLKKRKVRFYAVSCLKDMHVLYNSVDPDWTALMGATLINVYLSTLTTF